MDKIVIQELEFIRLIKAEEIQNRIRELANLILNHYQNTLGEIHVLIIMNGGFMFASDLLRFLDQRFIAHFIRIKSYDGFVQSEEIRLDADVSWDQFKNKPILLIEDIIDSGRTLRQLHDQMKSKEIENIITVSLLIKPNSVITEFENLFYGFTIQDEFVIGYGMDYNGIGRGLEHIYQLKVLS
jgi:hypoxanthine phosphoribosyltransferase